MSNKDGKSLDKRLSIAVCGALEQLMQNIENEPDLILEGENPVDGETTLREISTWLFVRRESDGYTDNSTDK